MNGWLQEFPTPDQASLRIVKKTLDEGNRRSNGPAPFV